MRFLLVIVFAMLSLASATKAAPGDVTAVPDLAASQRARELVALMNEIYPETLGLLEREFPEDHAELMRDLSRIGTSRGDARAIALVAADRLADLRRSYVDEIAEAPPVAHSAMLGHLANLYDAVFAAEGSGVCARVARDGSAVLYDLGLATKYASALDRQSHVYFEAVLLARQDPVEPVEAVREEDWVAVFQIMAGAGAPRAYLDAIASGDPTHPDICPALALLLRTAGLLDTPEGLRVRVDFARNLTGY